MYGFTQHVGYPTAAHKEAIAEFGPCQEHRRSFRGVREHVVELTSPVVPPDPRILRKSLEHFA